MRLCLQLLAALLVLGALIWFLVRSSPQRVEARGPALLAQAVELDPGQSLEASLAHRPLILSIPSGEDSRWGNLRLEREGCAALAIERPGSLIELFEADFDGDGRPRLLLVFENPGSGARKALALVGEVAGQLESRALPDLGAAFEGYLGGGDVSVHRPIGLGRALLEQSYPVYQQHMRLASRPLDAVLRGKSPVEFEGDGGAGPSGGSGLARFDFVAWDWLPAWG